ncbi:MAG TPA: hypothetical protein VGQ24_13315 [Gemmatimonadales bacterium]|jgi:hypothetical protein|nr:hypothetical protein [Gemmatimonadales bacterium]
MASLAYNRGVKELLNATTDYLTATMKVALLSTATAYTPDQDHDFMDAGGANDPTDAELNVTGYTRGFGGAGRKTMASKTVTENDTNNRVEFDCADITWTALGSGQTIAQAVVIKEVTNDAATVLYGLLDPTDTPTNGSDITLQVASNGWLNWTT